jgi:hypothetical protein
VITVELASRLKAAGLEWDPRPGDRFALPIRGLDDRVYVVSDMTIETQVVEGGRIVKFNGTTEWALDSIPQDEVIWLPHEAQLRELLGPRFVRLEAVPDGFVVVLAGPFGDPGPEERHVDIDAERAYGRALLSALRG